MLRKCAIGFVLLGVGVAFAGTPFGGDDAGAPGHPQAFIPPDQATLTCESTLLALWTKDAVCINKCLAKRAAEAAKGTPGDDEACEMKCGGSFVKKATAFEMKHPCPSCVASPAALHAFLVGAIDGGVSASIDCAGTTPLGGDDAGLVPPDAATAKCEVGVNKNFGKFLPAANGKCHIQQAASAFSHQTFDEEGCEGAFETKYNAANKKLTGCPSCLDAKAVFEGNVNGFDEFGLSRFYCASPSGAFVGFQ